jgi:hypothetical protein
MARIDTDLLIFGTGIASLWCTAHLRARGYKVIMICDRPVGGDQTLAAQGIIHAGLKYALSGKITKLARSISAMPQHWLDALHGKGTVDLSGARVAAQGQELMIPDNIMGGLVSRLSQTVFKGQIYDHADWRDDILSSGFQGHIVQLPEPVVDVPSVVTHIFQKNQSIIFQTSGQEIVFQTPHDIVIGNDVIHTQACIFACGAGNQKMATNNQDEPHIQMRLRPLMMGFLKPAPFLLSAHLIGTSDKPLATITTHTLQSGEKIWYIGGQVSERATSSPPEKLFKDILKILMRFFPAFDFQQIEMAALALERAEGFATSSHQPPDRPIIQRKNSNFYIWPSKMTFAPLLATQLEDDLKKQGINASGNTNWEPESLNNLANATLAIAPWEDLIWTQPS